MNIADFDIYRDLLKAKSGLTLTQDKAYLIESRLNPVSKKWGYENIGALTKILRGVPPKELVNDIVEAMTTNETSFFRDNTPFENLKSKVIPYFKQNPRPNKTLRIWCAAASSGQEPYSIAMLLKEEAAMHLPGWKFQITATDISHEILEQAKEGLYTQFEIQRGLPITYLMKYFKQMPDNKWGINQDIKDMITFKYFNLLDNMVMLGKYDIIFCRNVLIYFDQPTKKDVMERSANLLEDDGFYFLGGAETVLGITNTFQNVPNCRGLYAKSKSQHIVAA